MKCFLIFLGLFRQTARQQRIKRKLIFSLSEIVKATFPEFEEFQFYMVVSATQRDCYVPFYHMIHQVLVS